MADWFPPKTPILIAAIRLGAILNKQEAINKLKDTEALLKDGYWIQHSEQDGKGGYCLLGAMRRVSALSNAFALQAVKETINGEEIPIWNDASRRKKREVYKVLRKARRRLRWSKVFNT